VFKVFRPFGIIPLWIVLVVLHGPFVVTTFLYALLRSLHTSGILLLLLVVVVVVVVVEVLTEVVVVVIVVVVVVVKVVVAVVVQ
jgi:hypothetical protein